MDPRDQRLSVEICDLLSGAWKLVIDWNGDPAVLVRAHYKCQLVIRMLELILKLNRVED